MGARRISTSEAAAELGISRSRMHQLIAAGRVLGVERVGSVYIIESPVRVEPPLDNKHRTPGDRKRLRKSAKGVSK